MSWKEIAIYIIFVIVILFIYRGAMKTEAYPNKPVQPKKITEKIGKWEKVTEPIPNKLNMTNEEIELVLTDLEKRSVEDCVLTRASYGFKCEEIASGKIYKVKTK